MKPLIVFAFVILVSAASWAQSIVPDHSLHVDPRTSDPSFSGQSSCSGSHKSYTMTLSADGEPHFEDASLGSNKSGNALLPQASSAYWDSMFYNHPNYDSLIDRAFVHAVAYEGSDIFVGGSFEYLGGTEVYNIAHYNNATKTWEAMGNGFNGIVYCLAFLNGKLYAGGAFTQAGFNKTTAMNHIAVWNGSTWQQVGGGLNGNVESIAVYDSSVIVGGNFSQAGDANSTQLSNVAAWDGTSWDDMSAGLNSNVSSLLTVGNIIYAGGDFNDNALGIHRLAQYQSGNWQSVGNGVSGDVYALASVHDTLWVGGDFTATDDLSQVLNGLAIWDGKSIEAISDGQNVGVGAGNVYVLAAIGDSVYIGGSFSNIGGVPAHSIGKWSNGSIHQVGNGLYGTVQSITNSPKTGTMVGGVFDNANGVLAGGLIQLASGDTWQFNDYTPIAVGGYRETSVQVVAENSQYIFIGGYFTRIKGQPMRHIAAWNRQTRTWMSLGDGLDQGVRSMYLLGSKLYVGGAFIYAGDSLVNHIAYYDLNTGIWHSMGSGQRQYVQAIGSDGKNIYAVNYYGIENSGFRTHIGKWDGTSWTELPGAISGVIYAIAPLKTSIYIGGSFDYIDGPGYSNIAQFDGTSWNTLAEGVSNTVYALLPNGSDLYVGGGFLLASGDTVSGIARWDGQSWNPVGSGFNDYVTALAMYGGKLYAGGYFSSAGTVEAYGLASWDGNQWSEVGNGLGGAAYCLAADSDGLCVGGFFSNVSVHQPTSFPSYRFGIYHFGTLGVVTSNGSTVSLLEQNMPNPFSSTTKIDYFLPSDRLVKIDIYNTLGVNISTLVNSIMAAGEHEVTFDGSSIPSGVYCCRFQAGDDVETKWLTVVK